MFYYTDNNGAIRIAWTDLLWSYRPNTSKVIDFFFFERVFVYVEYIGVIIIAQTDLVLKL